MWSVNERNQEGGHAPAPVCVDLRRHDGKITWPPISPPVSLLGTGQLARIMAGTDFEAGWPRRLERRPGAVAAPAIRAASALAARAPGPACCRPACSRA